MTELFVLIVSLNSERIMRKHRGMNGKRVIAVTIRMSEEDDASIRQVAKKLWPGAVMSQAAVILSLALQRRDQVLHKSERKKKKASE